MRIAEVFESVQGEGQLAGTPSVFLRTTGCNLRCWFCDTPYTSWQPEGVHADWRHLIERVQEFSSRHVVVTGGEPMLQPDIVPLTQALAQLGLHVTIETAGTVDRPVHADLMSVSPKLANSTPQDGGRWRHRHDQFRDRPDVIGRFVADYTCQLKFVIDRPEDMDEVQRHLERLPQVRADMVWLMPQGIELELLREKLGWLEAIAQSHGYHVARRLHIELFGNVRGT